MCVCVFNEDLKTELSVRNLQDSKLKKTKQNGKTEKTNEELKGCPLLFLRLIFTIPVAEYVLRLTFKCSIFFLFSFFPTFNLESTALSDKLKEDSARAKDSASFFLFI